MQCRLHEDTLTFEINPTTPLQEDTLTFEMNPTIPLHEDTLTFEINPTTPLHEDTLTFEKNPTTPLHEDTLTFEINPTTPLHKDTLTFEINPTTPLQVDTLTFEMNPITPLHEDTLTFEMNPTTPLHEDTLTFEINPTTPLHEDTLTFEMNPTTPLHEDTLTFEINQTTPLHEDTSNGQPPETPHQEVQRCTKNTPCKLPGCMICQPLLNQVPQIHWFPQPILTLLLNQTLCPIQGFQPTHSNLILQPILTLRPIQLIRLNLTLSPSQPDPSSLIPSLTSDSTEARNLAPAPSSRPEPAQDEFHADHTETEQLNCILSSN